MKTWKKVTSMLVAATMVGSFAACGDKGGDEPDNTQLSKNYAAAVSNTLESAKSVKLTASMSLVQSETPIGGQTITMNGVATMEIIISEDTEGYSLSMKAVADDGEEKNIAEMILKGQYMYGRAYTDGTQDVKWMKEDIGFPIDLETIVEEFTDMPWATVEEFLALQEIADIKAQAQEMFAQSLYQQLEAGKAENGIVSVNVDYASFFNGWVSYLDSVDESKTTLGQFFDATAAKAGLMMTYDGLVNGLSAFASKTVGEAVDILNAYAQENYNKTLQQLKDELTQGELADLLFVDVLQLTAEQIQTIKDLQISDLTASVKDMKVSEFINAMMASQEPEAEASPANEDLPATDTEPVDYVQNVLAQMAAMKNQTLEALGLSIQEIPVTANKLAFNGSLSFNADGTALIGMSFGANVDINVELFSDETGEKYADGKAAVNFQFAISEFSTSTVTINAPAADQIESNEAEAA